jgi:hypothetical protein
VWVIIVLFGVSLAILGVFVLPRRVSRNADLGTISSQWLIEHRNQRQ